MRVRKIVNRGSTTKVIGKFPSLKMGKTVWFESQIERDYIYLLEFDGDVLSYQEQPERVRYTREGRTHTYTPDFLVRRTDGEQLVEVKPEEQLAREENVALFRSIAPVIREQGREFLVVTDRIIRAQPRLENIKLLWRYARVPIIPRHHLYCQHLLGDGRQVSLAEMFDFFRSKRVPLETAYALLYRGVIGTDITRPVSHSSMVFLPAAASAAGRKAS